MKGSRGFTLAEAMVAAILLALLLSAVAAAMLPMLGAPGRADAATDALAPVASGLYMLQRDLRESDANGVFACTPEPVACGDGTGAMRISAIVVATARWSGDLGAPFETANGTPSWQGFLVYWQADGGGTVFRAFVAVTGLDGLLGAQQPDRVRLGQLARSAAIAAEGQSGSTSFDSSGPSIIAMRSVASIAATVFTADRNVALQVVTAGSSGGAASSASFATHVFTRN